MVEQPTADSKVPSLCTITFFSVVHSCCIEVDIQWTSQRAADITFKSGKMLQECKRRGRGHHMGAEWEMILHAKMSQIVALV